MRQQLIFALYKQEATGLQGYAAQGWEVLAVSPYPEVIVEELLPWVELNANWPISERREAVAAITALQQQGKYQVEYTLPVNEPYGSFPIVLQFGYAETGN